MAHHLGMTYRMSQPGHCPPDFKTPSEQPQIISSAPSNPKKRRKTSNTNASLPPQPPPTPQDLLPPPLTGYGDTIVASNPFDDTPSMIQPMNHMLMHGMNHMQGPPLRGMHPMGINALGGLNQMGNSGMIGVSMSPHMNNRGGMSPMSAMGNANIGGMSPLGNIGPNLSPMGPMGVMSPMGGGPNGNRPMGSPMSSGPIGSPMNTIPMGSPMGAAMGSPLSGGPPHINNGSMGPPMHSPISNSPSHIQGSRLNGSINTNGGPSGLQMSPHSSSSSSSSTVGGPNNSMTMSPSNMNQNSGPNPINNSNMNVLPHIKSEWSSSGIQQINSNNIKSEWNPSGIQQISSNNINNSSNNNPMNTNMLGMNIAQHHQMGAMSSNAPVNGPINQMGMFGSKPMPISAGKVYPPGQPMVFNPQNPSAPPIYACGLCHKEVNDNDEALFCESGCNFFFHR